MMNRLLALSRLRLVARAIVWASHDRAASSVSSYRNCLLMPTMTWRTRAAMTVARCQHPTIALQPTRWLPTCGGRRRMHATTTTTTSSATTPTASATASDTSNDEDDWPLEHLSRDDIYQHYMRKLEDNPDDALAACVAGIIELTRKKVATADSGAIPQAAADEADGGARAAVPLLTESLTQPDRSVPSVERVLQVDRDVALPQPNHQRHQRQQHQQASAAPWTDASDGRQRRKAFVRWVREEGRRLREMQGAAGETEAPTPAEHERLQRAYQLLLHSATLGFPLAAHFVGYLTIRGLGTQVDLPRGLEWLEQAAAAGSALSQIELATFYLQGPSEHRNLAKSIAFFVQAAEENDDDHAMYCLGHLYHAEEYLPREIDKALAWLHRSADAGNADANYYLAMMHITSDGIQGQDKMALEYLHKAAITEHGPALHYLGDVYYRGLHGCAPDYTQALEFYLRAGLQNVPQAYHNAGLMLFNGVGTRADRAKAFYVFQRAAHLSFAPSCRVLAGMYRQGITVPASPETAQRFDELADRLERATHSCGNHETHHNHNQ